METILIEATPANPITGATVNVALAGKGEKPYTHRSRNDWRAGVVGLPRFRARIEWGEDGFGGGALPETAIIEWRPAQPSALAAVANLLWNKAAIEVYVGDDATGSFPLIIRGEVEKQEVRSGSLLLTIRDNSRKLDDPLAPDTFAGTGGVEGDDVAAERIRRRTWGKCSNIEALPFATADLIYELGDLTKPLSAIDDVRDIGRSASSLTTVAWQGTVASTLTALKAASAPDGGGVRAPSIACVKWWTQPVGPLTADVRGEVGSGYVDTIGTIAERIAAVAGVTVNNPSDANGWRTGSVGIHIDNPNESAAQALDRLLRGASLVWNADTDGDVTLAQISFASPVETVAAIRISRNVSLPPLKKRQVGYKRNHRIHSDSEIAGVLLDKVDGIEDGADISTAVVGPAQVTIRCDSSMQPKAGQVNPRYLQFSLRKGGTDITTSATWSRTNDTAGLSSSMSNSSGSKGRLNITAVASDGQITAIASYNGKTFRATVQVTRIADYTSSSGSGPPTLGTINTTAASSSLTAISAQISVTVGPSGTVILQADYDFGVTSPADGTWQGFARWYRHNGSVFAAIGSEVAGGYSIMDLDPSNWVFQRGYGGCDLNDTGRTPGAVEVYKLYGRVSPGATINWSGVVAGATS